MIKQFSLANRRITACVLGMASLVPALGQSDDPTINKNHITVSTHFSFNTSVRLSHLPVASKTGGEFDDGFVRPDISGSATETQYFAYDTPGQHNVASPTVTFDRTTSPLPREGQTQTYKDDPQPGFEVSYSRELGRFRLGKNREASWGASLGFTSTELNLALHDSVSGNVTRSQTTYNLTSGNGAVVPPGPYTGGYDTPGAYLDFFGAGGAAPGVTTSTASILSQYTGKVDGLAYGAKLGGYLTVPITKRFAFDVGLGLAAINAEADLIYTETFSLAAGAAGGPPAPRKGSISKSDWLMGGYAHGLVSFALNDSFDVFLGGEYQTLGDFTIRGIDREATVKFGGVFSGLAGIRFGF